MLGLVVLTGKQLPAYEEKEFCKFFFPLLRPSHGLLENVRI
jgi:hypothetical protein